MAIPVKILLNLPEMKICTELLLWFIKTIKIFPSFSFLTISIPLIPTSITVSIKTSSAMAFIRGVNASSFKSHPI